MKRMLSLLLSLALVLALVAGCDTGSETGPATTVLTSGTKLTGTSPAGTTAAGRPVADPAIDRELFGGSGSYDSLAASIEAILATGAFSGPMMYKTMTGMPVRNGAPADAAGTAATGQAASGESGYSGTNVQVAGVDEADTVKTDGRYLYYVANGRVYILDAANRADVIHTWTFKRNVKDGKKITNENPVELYLDPVGKRLTMIIQGSQYEPFTPPPGPADIKPAETKPAETRPAATKPAATGTAAGGSTGASAVEPVAPDQPVQGMVPAATLIAPPSGGSEPATGAGSAGSAGSASSVSGSAGASASDAPSPVIDLPASGVASYGFAPYPLNQRSYVVTRVYSVADPKTPRLLRTYSQEGNYLSSRLVDGTAFILSSKHDYRIYQTGVQSTVRPDAGTSSSGSVTPETTVPKQKVDPQQLKDSLPKVSSDPDKDEWTVLPADRIGIVPQGDPSSQLIISTIPVANDALKADTISLLGASGIVYASKDNIYIANHVYGRYNASSKKYEETPPSMKIYRMRIAGGRIAADGTGTVPGAAINQFAMDEHNGYFRIATTLSSFTRTPAETRNQSESTVYVLDKGLKIVGQVGKLGPGETIRSVRFMGDRAYVVTFRTTDPLYVLDLKTPTAPKVLGELKIPGFSTYLHPYGENQLIGFGYDAVVEGSNAYQTGIKVSLFDITDVTKPKERSTLIFGGRGSYSALDQSHKALLFSADKNVIAFPAVISKMSGGDKMSHRTVFQGLVVLAVEDGKLVLRGSLGNSAKLNDVNGDGLSYDKMTQADHQAISGYDSVTRGVLLGSRIITLSSRLIRQYPLDSLKLDGETVLPGYEAFHGIDYGMREPVAMPALK